MENNASESIYMERIGEEAFDNLFCCKGEQLIKILENILDETRDMCWYGADIQFAALQSEDVRFPEISHKGLTYIKNTAEFIQKLKGIIQFSSGVFIAFDKNTMINWDKVLTPETEESEGIQHPLGIIEIRAFDYSYFELYTKNRIIYDKIQLFKR